MDRNISCDCVTLELWSYSITDLHLNRTALGELWEHWEECHTEDRAGGMWGKTREKTMDNSAGASRLLYGFSARHLCPSAGDLFNRCRGVSEREWSGEWSIQRSRREAVPVCLFSSPGSRPATLLQTPSSSAAFLSFDFTHLTTFVCGQVEMAIISFVHRDSVITISKSPVV